MILCPECDSNIDVDEEDLDEGEIISCSECDTDFEVVTTEPLELARVANEEEEDEDKRDDDEEENEDGDY